MTKIELLKQISDWNIKRIAELDEDQEISAESKPLFQDYIDYVALELKDILNFIQEKVNENDPVLKLDPYWLVNLAWVNMYDFDPASDIVRKILGSKNSKKYINELKEVGSDLLKWNMVSIELNDFARFISDYK